MVATPENLAKLDPSADPERLVHWRDDQPEGSITPATWLSIESREPFVLHFGHDDWQEVQELASWPLASGWHAAQLDLTRIALIQTLEFTRRFVGPRGWEQRDWFVCLRGGSGESGLP